MIPSDGPEADWSGSQRFHSSLGHALGGNVRQHPARAAFHISIRISAAVMRWAACAQTRAVMAKSIDHHGCMFTSTTSCSQANIFPLETEVKAKLNRPRLILRR